MNWTYAECFAGIGAWGKAIKQVTEEHGDSCELKWYAEIDKYASNAFAAIHEESEDKNIWDITKDIDVEEVDVLFYSPPCQTFSIAGNREGTEVDKGNLFYNALEKIKKAKPKYAIMENVKGLTFGDTEKDFYNMIYALDEAGYESYWQILNSKDYGIPQNRERVFIVSIRKDLYEEGKRFEFPKPMKLEKRLFDMLEDEVDDKYILSDDILNKITLNEKILYKNFDKIKNEVNQITNIKDTKNFGGNPQTGRVYGNGLSPTLNTMQGGGLEPKVLIKSATKDGYEVAEVGDSVTLDQPNSETRRGRVGEQVSQTLTTSCNVGVINPLKGKTNNGWHFEQQVYDNKGITRSLKAGGGSGNIPKVIEKYKNLSIRKLTPLECFRLQGFDDEDYHKAVKAYDEEFGTNVDGTTRSDSQMYKRAGNSITVNVIVEILENLLYDRKQEGVQLKLF